MANNTGKTPHQVEVFYVSENDHGGFKLLGASTQTSEPAELIINTKAYDEDSRNWVDNTEAYEKAEELLKSLGASSVETALDDLNALAMTGSLILPEVYILGDVARWTPISEFTGNRTQFNKIDAKIAKALKAHKDENLQTLPVEEYVGYRFNFGVNVDDMNIRISQIVFTDEDGEVDEEIPAVSVKYTTKRIDTYREDLKEGKVVDSMIDSVNKTVDRLVAIERKKKVEELSELFGKDFEQMIKDGDTFEGKISTQKFGKDNYFAILAVPASGIELIPGEVSEEETE